MRGYGSSPESFRQVNLLNMKKIFIIAALLLISLGAFAQEGRNIYNKWSDSEGVSAVYISPSMFKMIGKLPEVQIEMGNGQSMDIAPLINSLSGFYMLDISGQSIVDKVKADVRSMVSKGRYDLMMEVKDDGENVRIYTAGNDKVIESLVFLCNSSGDVQFICIDGTINRSDLEDFIASAAR